MTRIKPAQILAAATSRFFGRITASGGPGEELTGTQATTLLDVFTSALKGLAPLSGGGTVNFLRADATWASPDPWTYIKLASDYVAGNNTTFVNITDGTVTLVFTPPANTDWELEGRILIETATATNLPRIGVKVVSGATAGYGAVNIWQMGATTNVSVNAAGGWKNPGSDQNFQIAAGGLPSANIPAVVEVIASGRSGASPTAISIQLANETAGATMGKALRGSFMKYRFI